MEFITSRITGKGQITIPKRVRESLSIGVGDLVVFEMREGEAVIRKLHRPDPDWGRALRTTLDEWEDDLDDEL